MVDRFSCQAVIILFIVMLMHVIELFVGLLLAWGAATSIVICTWLNGVWVTGLLAKQPYLLWYTHDWAASGWTVFSPTTHSYCNLHVIDKFIGHWSARWAAISIVIYTWLNRLWITSLCLNEQLWVTGLGHLGSQLSAIIATCCCVFHAIACLMGDNFV